MVSGYQYREFAIWIISDSYPHIFHMTFPARVGQPSAAQSLNNTIKIRDRRTSECKAQESSHRAEAATETITQTQSLYLSKH